mgnify:CR=1 FL=1
MQKNKNKAVSGIAWSAIERFSVQGVQFLVSIVLARLLTPADFGLIAIVLVFSVIFQTINESGLNTALIYKQDRDELDFSTAFYTNIGIGIVSYLLLFFASPWIASFYESDELISVMRVLSLNLIISSLGLVQLAKYTIKVDFKTQARASLIASLISGATGIIIACISHSVYAIVAQQLTNNSIYVLLMWIFAKWKPMLAFSFARFKVLFTYAYKLILARLISVLFDDIYSLAIGKLYTPTVLGYYNRAMSFRAVLSRNLISIVQRVSIPMLCEAQKNNNEMQKVLLKFMSSTALFVYPLLAGLMVLSKPLVLVVLGEKWLDTSTMLILGCPVGFFYLISTFNRNVFNATGRTDWALKAEIIKKTIFIGIFLITMNYPIKVLLIGLIVISIIEMIIDTAYSRMQIGISLYAQIKSLFGILCAVSVMSFAVAIVIFLISNIYIQLFVGFVVGVLVYSITCFLFNICNFRNELRNVVNKIF